MEFSSHSTGIVGQIIVSGDTPVKDQKQNIIPFGESPDQPLVTPYCNVNDIHEDFIAKSKLLDIGTPIITFIVNTK